MADSNPANFANLPKDKLKEIASKGGQASHGGNTHSGNTSGEDSKQEAVRAWQIHTGD
jgi:general stress protein YciG